MYAAVSENLAAFLERADELGRGVPKFVRDSLSAYLKCGILAHGFARVRCDDCKEELLVGFSCKTRGICPSCDSKRAQLSAAHLVDNVLPKVAFRQWTLSFPIQLRWHLGRDSKLLSRVLSILVRAVFAHQRRLARRLGHKGEMQPGAVSFTQRFGSALQMTPHFHVLVPEGLWSECPGGTVNFEPLPPPSTQEVERLLVKVRRKVLQLLEREGC